VTETVAIELRGVPLDLYGASAAHIDALQREFEMVLRDEPDVAAQEVPRRLRALVQHIKERFSDFRESADAEIAAARERGDAVADLTYEAPVDLGAELMRLRDLLEEADEYCRSGDLMTLASPPEVRAYRNWFFGEFERQSRGEPPTPWIGPPAKEQTRAREGGGGAAAEGGDQQAWDVAHDGSAVRLSFSGDLDLESAPHLRTIVAEASQRPDLSELVIDLSSVTFLDSVGLSVLLTVRTRLASDDVVVKVVPSDAVRRVFELAGVDALF
jgi:anti-anti-sigma factor